MAAKIGRETTDLTERILNEAQSFTLGQALRLLSYLHSQKPEECQAFIQKKIFIHPWLSLAFPANEITSMEKSAQHYDLTTTLFGLYSTLGPLPTLYTEELLEEARRDESVSRDFLDILNNHLTKLRYAAYVHNWLELRTVENASLGMAHLQFCLMGQAALSLRDTRLPRARLAEILVRRTHSASQLEVYLSYMLDREDIRVEQCVERYALIPLEQRCRLGLANATLGQDAMLGMRLRDSNGKFRLHFEQIDPDEMANYLPGREGHLNLAQYLRRFLMVPFVYELDMHPKPKEPSPNPLGLKSAIGFYLGRKEKYPTVRVFWKS